MICTLPNYGRHTERTAAHVIPVSMEYENIVRQLGGERDYALGSDYIWSLRNGIVISSQLEQAIDASVFMIVPIKTPEEQPQYLQMILVNMDKVDQPINELECKITSRIFSSSYGRTCTKVSTRLSL